LIRSFVEEVVQGRRSHILKVLEVEELVCRLNQFKAVLEALEIEME